MRTSVIVLFLLAISACSKNVDEAKTKYVGVWQYVRSEISDTGLLNLSWPSKLTFTYQKATLFSPAQTESFEYSILPLNSYFQDEGYEGEQLLKGGLRIPEDQTIIHRVGDSLYFYPLMVQGKGVYMKTP